MMWRFSKEAYYGVNHVSTKTCEPWVLAYDKHMCIYHPCGAWEVIPNVEDIESGSKYFQVPAYVHKNWIAWEDDHE